MLKVPIFYREWIAILAAVVTATASREIIPLYVISGCVPLMLLCRGHALNKMPSVGSRESKSSLPCTALLYAKLEITS